MVDDYGLDFFFFLVLAWIGLDERCNCHEEDRITKLCFWWLLTLWELFYVCFDFCLEVMTEKSPSSAISTKLGGSEEVVAETTGIRSHYFLVVVSP